MAHASDSSVRIGRRRLLQGSLLTLGSAALGTRQPVWAQGRAPAAVTPDRLRPAIPCGVQSGDVTADRAIVWSKTDRPARLIVEYSTSDSFRNARRLVGPAALAETDFTARVDLTGLPAGQEIFYRVLFQDLADPRVLSAPAAGRLRTPPMGRGTVTFAWSGDEAGQGWGINPGWGGMKMYDVMRRANPAFFIHSGDQIYADGPIPAEFKLDDGTLWKNVTSPAKAKVAESLAEYRGNFAYNFLDEHKRRFCAEVPMLVQWDDHEVRNNWYPGQMLGDERYTVKSASLLAAWAKRAMFEYNPFRLDATDPERVYRSFAYGPSLEVFMLDERSYRGPNTANRQPALDAEAAFLGPEQMRWLRRALFDSRATWKVIASDMPLSIVVPDLNPDVPKGTYEAWANADDSLPLGRELELAGLLAFIKANGISNVVWLHRRRPLRLGDLVQPGARQVHRLHALLGVRGGAHQRGNLRPRPDRPDLRPRGALPERAGGHEAESSAQRGHAVLRHGRNRRRHRGHDRRAARHRGPDPVQDRPEPRGLNRGPVRRRSIRSRRSPAGSPPAFVPPRGSPAPPAGSRVARCARRGRWSPPRRRD